MLAVRLACILSTLAFAAVCVTSVFVGDTTLATAVTRGLSAMAVVFAVGAFCGWAAGKVVEERAAVEREKLEAEREAKIAAVVEKAHALKTERDAAKARAESAQQLVDQIQMQRPMKIAS